MRKVDPEDYLCLGAHSIRGVQTGVVVWSPGLKSSFLFLHVVIEQLLVDMGGALLDQVLALAGIL